MPWKMVDAICLSAECGEEFEFLTADPEEVIECPRCEHSAARKVSAPMLGLICNDPERRKEALKKRSADHTASEQRKGNMMSPKDLKDGKPPIIGRRRKKF
jgi:DNA-directed RNA polymerase subunit RPC12/RpoP